MIEYAYIRKGDANVWLAWEDVKMLLVALAEAENSFWMKNEQGNADECSKLYDSLKEIDDEFGEEE